MVSYTTTFGEVSGSMCFGGTSTLGLTGGNSYSNISYNPNTFTYSNISTDPNVDVEGDVIIKGNIYLDGDMYQNGDKVGTKTQEDHDVEIEVVDNGYTAKIGSNTYVFTDLDGLENWVEETFKTPKDAKENIRKVKGITKERQDLLDRFNKLALPPIKPQPWSTPTTDPLVSPYIGGTSNPQITYSSNSASTNSFLNKFFGSRKKAKDNG